jgi:hypothetical protein
MLRLNIFGRFRAENDFGDEIPIKSKKGRALLAYLAMPPGKPRGREELMALLWSDRGEEQARGSLRQALSGLRRDLGGDATMRLIREWNGSSHVVESVDGGFVWNGKRYGSLSAVARAITGARWSGPRFFGLESDQAP